MLKELPKKGSKVMYLGGDSLALDLTVGKVYEVVGYSSAEDEVEILDDAGDLWPIYGASHECDTDLPHYVLVEEPTTVGELAVISSDGTVSYRVEAKLANGATVTGFPSDVAAVIRNLEQAEFRAEIRDEGDYVPGDIVMWGIDIAEVMKASEGMHTEVKIGPNVFIAETESLTLVAGVESRYDKEAVCDEDY